LRAGNRLLQSREYNLVYISTANFMLFLLGPIWWKRHGIPFVLDFHDPCYRKDATPPVWARAKLKYALNRWVSKHVEAKSVIAASGIVAVSSHYLDTLDERYAKLNPAWLR